MTERIEGDYTVTEDQDSYGTITGNVTVKSGARFISYGLVNGNVTVESGADFLLCGLVGGDIVGQGHTEVAGLVKGAVTTPQALIRKNAIVGRTRYTEDTVIN